jgi:hypothetical protein
MKKRSVGRCQDFLFRLQNTEGEPLVGGWVQIHQPEVLPPYFAARKENPGRCAWQKRYNENVMMKFQLQVNSMAMYLCKKYLIGLKLIKESMHFLLLKAFWLAIFKTPLQFITL